MMGYDDPYSFLALYLISISSNAVVGRIMTDDDYLHKMVIKEVRGQDFMGPFVDCAITEILQNKRRMEMCHELDKFADYLFSKIDLSRLRAKIKFYADRYGIILES